MLNKFAKWREVRRNQAALNALSPRQLDDIGLVPGDIRRVARGSF